MSGTVGELMDSKAQKLAAARKKLKEYQNRSSTEPTTAAVTTSNLSAVDVAVLSARTSSTTPTNIIETTRETPPPPFVRTAISTGTQSSNVSEISNSELNLSVTGANGESGGEFFERTKTPVNNDSLDSFEIIPQQTAASYFSSTTAAPSFEINANFDALATQSCAVDRQFSDFQTDTIIPTATNTATQHVVQVLITEKAQLVTELEKERKQRLDMETELEELRVQHHTAIQRLEESQQRCAQQQTSVEKLRDFNAELTHKLAQMTAGHDEQTEHLAELRKQLNLSLERSIQLDKQLKENSNELEMAQLRIRQISDDTNTTKDDRVETLTQTQFMYEQQIRDLQAMVQQLTEDKDQANLQYQSYVQHMKSELSALGERNADLSEECTKLQEREQQLVLHISGIEREMQKNISRQGLLKQKEQEQQQFQQTNPPAEGAKLQERIDELELERHEFQLKIKSQEDRLTQFNEEQERRQLEVEQLQDHLKNVAAEQPDRVKLLASIESDKVAASRALTQNVEMKKQLDELELRFVQLTNDKADLVNRLDAEEYSNREMRSKYIEMEERLRTSDERFKFKDDEMIRLSNENVDLTRKNDSLQKKLDKRIQYEEESEDRDDNECDEEYADDDDSKRHYHDHDHNDHRHNCAHDERNHHDRNSDSDDHSDHNDGDNHDYHNTNAHIHQHTHDNDNEKYANPDLENTTCREATEHMPTITQYERSIDKSASKLQPRRRGDQTKQTEALHDGPLHIPSSEAVEKLEQRFTLLMSQVADLTDEKQRLEHLVMQLQSETETIGEYITLYQQQRRMLKQREYEKAAQMQQLKSEREQLQEKITILNNLVSSLGGELPVMDQKNSPELFDLEINTTTTDLQSNNYHDGRPTSNINQSEIERSVVPASSVGVFQHENRDPQAILNKIQNIISEIKEDTKDMPVLPATLQNVDHLNCCLGKFEVV